MTATPVDTTSAAVEFAAPLPGLSPHTAFRLERIPEAQGLYALRASEADVRLFLIDAPSVGGGYAPRLPEAARAEIGAAEASDLRVLVVANPTDDGVYLNLRAPIVIDRETGRATQVILEDPAYPIRALVGG
ncbi:flagellar assembly protein FliW [Microbacterium sp. 179-I 3D4 NHS]|uniref:flagellar assembly protein FliW n=1 Tax=Microbacterium sp. 179-I 3D4 NHS TaxID=3142381 RepID=UPI0039A07756